MQLNQLHEGGPVDMTPLLENLSDVEITDFVVEEGATMQYISYYEHDIFHLQVFKNPNRVDQADRYLRYDEASVPDIGRSHILRGPELDRDLMDRLSR